MAEIRMPQMSQGIVNAVEAATDLEIRTELDLILASSGFRASRRCQDFLRYVVESTLGGHSENLKERTIGIDVFNKPASYDPGEDATVRVKAGEVRKRLGVYYSTEGGSAAVRIELPHGTYVPEFHRKEVVKEIAEPIPDVPPRPRSRWRWAAPAALVVILPLLTWLSVRAPASVLDQFWAPVLRGSSPILLSASFVPIYALNRPANAAGPPRAEDFVPVSDQFVGGGDVLALSRLSSMLNRMRRDYEVKIGTGVSFVDLRTSPAILIGYSLTRWKEISGQLRFFIDIDRRPLMVTDNGLPTKWTLPNIGADRHTNEDYAIVSRVFHPDTRAMLVEVAGITQYGTEAAAELVTKPDLLAEALRGAPPGWQDKNLQIVLHVRVIAGTPASQKAVATYFW